MFLLCLLDASKAFDRVNYIHLFNELKTKALCPLVIRFLINMYIFQSMCVSWENEKSFNCVASNGVKQGGVLLSILYGICNDLLLTMLKESGMGCYVGCTLWELLRMQMMLFYYVLLRLVY